MDQKSNREEILPPLSEDEKMMAGLCYPLWFIVSPWVFYTKSKRDLFALFHAWQGLFFGIISTVATGFSFLLFFLIFFYRNPKSFASSTMSVKMILGWGTIILLATFVYLTLLAVLLFFTLWLGWKASNGRLFRFPIIGDIAYQKMNIERDSLERAAMESIVINIREEFNFVVEKQSEDVPVIESKEDKYIAAIQANPPIEMLKSIFTPQPVEEIEEVEEPENVEQEEVIVVEEKQNIQNLVEDRPLSPLEKLAQLRKKQAEIAKNQIEASKKIDMSFKTIQEPSNKDKETKTASQIYFQPARTNTPNVTNKLTNQHINSVPIDQKADRFFTADKKKKVDLLQQKFEEIGKADKINETKLFPAKTSKLSPLEQLSKARQIRKPDSKE